MRGRQKGDGAWPARDEIGGITAHCIAVSGIGVAAAAKHHRLFPKAADRIIAESGQLKGNTPGRT